MSLYRPPLVWIFILLIFIILAISYLLLDLSFLRIFFFGLLGIPTPGKCLILEEKNCKYVNFIENPNHKENLLAVYKVPTGSLLFSPVDGFPNSSLFSLKNDLGQFSKYPGFTVISEKNNKPEITQKIYSFVFISQKLNSYKETIKKESVIGTVSDKNIDILGNYNLVIAITKKTYNIYGQQIKFESDDNELKNILGSK